MARRHRTRRQRRKQKRRTLRQQRGGDMVTSLNEWIDAVKKHRNEFVTAPDAIEAKEYTFEQLKDKNLALPPPKKEGNGTSEREAPFIVPFEQYIDTDLRILGRALQAGMREFFPQTPLSILTPTTCMTAIRAKEGDAQFADLIDMLTTFEKALIGVAGDRASTFTAIQTADKTSFPLYIWYLMMNMPEEESVEEVPILLAPTQVQEVPSETGG